MTRTQKNKTHVLVVARVLAADDRRRELVLLLDAGVDRAALEAAEGAEEELGAHLARARHRAAERHQAPDLLRAQVAQPVDRRQPRDADEELLVAAVRLAL